MPRPKNQEAEQEESIYELCYYTGLVGKLYSFVHRSLEKPFKENHEYKRILELGAGSGEHLPFVKCNYELYVLTDIIGPNQTVQKILASSLATKFVKVDAHNLEVFETDYFDRVIATCLIVHLSDPASALREWRRVLKPGGTLTLYLAPEPGWLIRIARKLIFWPKAKKLGNPNPEFSAYQEHRTHFFTVRTSVENVFNGDLIVHRRFPTKLLSWNFSFFDTYQITKNATS
jgi:ubiquinone/menaquinone biosynthesis C-methylase UbiE